MNDQGAVSTEHREQQVGKLPIQWNKNQMYKQLIYELGFVYILIGCA